LTIEWSVRNIGTGTTNVDTWVDRIILSTDEIVGDADDRIIGEFVRSGGLAAGESYSESQTITLPIALEDRFILYVVTDVQAEVFEDGNEANNTARMVDFFDVVRRPYADLIVTEVAADANGSSGQPVTVSWTVRNNELNAIGATSTSSCWGRSAWAK